MLNSSFVVRFLDGKNSLINEQEILQYASAIGGDSAQLSHGAEVRSFATQLRQWEPADFQVLLAQTAEFPPPPAGSAAEQMLQAALRQLYHMAQAGELDDNSEILQQASEYYQNLGGECRPRWYLLATLAAAGRGDQLREFAEIYADDPPQDHFEASTALAPLFQRANYDPDDVFPQLLESLAHPQAAAPVLDLANFLTRNRQVDAHPAEESLPQLISLLKGVCARLEKLEHEPVNVDELLNSKNRVSDSVAIATSLCDTLGLVGDEQAKTALQDALHLRHRRIRVEAAAALARLGDDDAVVVLGQLAEYPSARLRAVAFAEELGLEDHIDDKWRTPIANAEAELACYLAEPQQLGAPPSEMELIEQRNLAWPSYDDRQECYLFRYSYRLGDAGYTNIGIAGPLVHAFHVDLTQLAIDDIFAIYAGWQAEHPEIREVPADQLNEAHQVIANNIVERIASEGVQVEKLVALGLFLGDPAVIATAKRGETQGAIVAGKTDAAWFPHDGTSERPIGPEEAWSIWKGRQLLSAFNEDVG